MATIAIDEQLPRRKRAKLTKAEAKAERRQLLAQRRFSSHKVLRWTMDFIKFLILAAVAAFVGKYAITGAYDLLWEMHQPLVRYAVEFLALAGLTVTYGSFRAGRGKPTSWGTVWFLSGLFTAWAVAVLIIHHLEPHIADSTALWHWIAPNDTVRDIFGRNWLEGLYGGLFGVFVGWDTVKRRSKHRLLSKPFKGWMSNLEEEDRDVRSWMVWITPVLVVVCGLPFAYLAWRGELDVSAHATAFHNWVRSVVPWHANVPLDNTQTTLLAKAQDSVTSALPMFIIGFASAKWFGRVPAFGVIDEYQEYLALRRIAKRGNRGLYGHLFHRGILRFYQSTGYQLALIQEYGIGVSKGEPVAYAQQRLAKYDHGLIVPLRLAQFLLWVLIPVGAYFLLHVAKYH